MSDGLTPFGYRLEYQTKEPRYLSPESYHLAVRSGYADCDTHGLYKQPQPGCSADVEVYFNRYWVRPEFAEGLDLSGFTALYRGPLIHAGPIPESELLSHPEIIERKLKRDQPDLF